MNNKLTGKILDMSLDLKTGKAKLMLELNEKQSALNVYESLNQEEKLSIDIKKYRNKRSLDANAYFWVLVDDIYNVVNVIVVSTSRYGINSTVFFT